MDVGKNWRKALKEGQLDPRILQDKQLALMFDFKKVLGSGGFGVVLQATDRRT